MGQICLTTVPIHIGPSISFSLTWALSGLETEMEADYIPQRKLVEYFPTRFLMLQPLGKFWFYGLHQHSLIMRNIHRELAFRKGPHGIVSLSNTRRVNWVWVSSWDVFPMRQVLLLFCISIWGHQGSERVCIWTKVDRAWLLNQTYLFWTQSS